MLIITHYKEHGVTPREAKLIGTQLKTYPRILLQISVTGEESIDYRIEEKESFRLVGIKETIRNDGIYNFQRVPVMWSEVKQNGMVQKIFELSNGKPWGVMGACANYSDDKFDYYIASSSNEQTLNDMVELIVEKSLWAVFP